MVVLGASTITPLGRARAAAEEVVPVGTEVMAVVVVARLTGGVWGGN